MRIVKIVFKIFLICVILIAIIIASIALYMEFYGKNLLENTLSNVFGSKVKFKSISLNLDRQTVNFKGFTILSEVELGGEIFNAEKFTLMLSKEKFDKEKKIVFEEIAIKKGVLNIARNRNGVFNLSYNNPGKIADGGAIAYADTPTGNGSLYNFVRNIKKLTIEDSIINFRDYYISQEPFAITCDNFTLYLTSSQEPASPSGCISVICTLGFRILNSRYRDGEVFFKASMAAYKDRVDMDTTLETRYIDLMQFIPYFDEYTPFSFNDGFFGSTTKFEMHNNMINSLTTMVFYRLRLIIDPAKENTQFLNTSVNKLAPYLTSSSGDIVFDFVIKGPAHNPQIGIGPKVKFAMGMVVIEELGNLMQQLQRLQR